MTTLELLQLQNEHKENNFYEKGEDFVCEKRWKERRIKLWVEYQI